MQESWSNFMGFFKGKFRNKDIPCKKTDPVNIVHGGAWTIPKVIVEESREGTKAAANAGCTVLSSGGTTIDAVEAALQVLEDYPCFDSENTIFSFDNDAYGRLKSPLPAKEEVEMDAVNMDGRTLKSGAVACVQNIKNPIKLARMVMEKITHTLLVGPGANLFAEERGFECVPLDSLVTERAKRDLALYKGNYDDTVKKAFKSKNVCRLKTKHTLPVGGGANVFAEEMGIECVPFDSLVTERAKRDLDLYKGNYDDTVNDRYKCGWVRGQRCGRHLMHGARGVHLQGRAGTPRHHRHEDRNGRTGGHRQGSCKHGVVGKKKGGVIVLSRIGDVELSYTTLNMSWARAKKGVVHSGVRPSEDIQEPVGGV